MNSKAITMIVASLVLGLAAVLVAARWVSGQSSVATAKVVVANKDLPIGSKLSADQLVVVDWPVAAAVGGSFSDPKTLDSRVINVSLQRGVPIIDSKLAPIGAKGGLSAVIAEGKRAMTVKVNEIVGVAGFALPGSLVDVVLSTQDQNSTPISKIVLEKILVLAIAQEAGRDETKPKVVSAVTLEVTPAQAEKLDLGRSVGTLSLVLRNHFDLQTVATPGTRKLDLLGLSADAPARQGKIGASGGAPARTNPGASEARPRKTIEVIRGIARVNTEMGTIRMNPASDEMPRMQHWRGMVADGIATVALAVVVIGIAWPFPLFAADPIKPSAASGEPASPLRLQAAASMKEGAATAPALAQFSTRKLTEVPGTWPVNEPVIDAEIAAPLRIASGKSRLVKVASDILRVAVGNPDNLDVILITPREVYVLGKQAGSTNIFLWSKGGKTTVLEITVSVDTVGLQETLRMLMPQEKGITVTAAGDSLVLTGMVSDSVKVHRAVSLAEQFGGRKVINLLGTANAAQVMLEVKIAEVSKTVMDRLGARVDGSTIGGGNFRYALMTQLLAGAAGVASIARGANSISIDAEIRNGLVKILAEPTIMAVSGQEGTFLAGGKIFIPVPQSGSNGTSGITLEEKEFGVGLRFTPTVLEGGQINLRVTPEVSELSQLGVPVTSTNGSTSILPSITTRRASTTVQLSDGQSFAIGGLVRNNVTETIRRFPGLGEIPVLGALFRSSEFQNDVSELLIIVTPRLVKPLAAVPTLPTDNFVPPSRTEFLLGGQMEGGAGAASKPPPAAQVGGASMPGATPAQRIETRKELR